VTDASSSEATPGVEAPGQSLGQTASKPSLGGVFVAAEGTGTEAVYWMDAVGKHPLAKGLDCSQCGCKKENIREMTQAEIDELPTADDFHCVAMNPPAPFGPTAAPPLGRFLRIDGAGSASGSQVPGASGADASKAGAGMGATSGSDAASVVGQAPGDSSSNGLGTSGSGSGSGAEGKSQGSLASASGSGQMWWEDSAGAVHLVPAGYDCSACGCGGEVSTVSAGEFGAMHRGEDFNCNMARKDNGKVLAAASPESAGATASATIDAKMAGDDKGSNGFWFILIPVVLALIALAACLLCSRGGKNRKRAVCLDCCDDVEKSCGLQEESGEESSDADEEQGSVVQDAAPSREPLLAAPEAAGAAVAVSSKDMRILPPQAASVRTSARGAVVAGAAASSSAVAGVAGGPQTVFDMIDRDHDGVLTREEWNKYAFDAFDRDHNGTVSHQEWTDGRTRP